VDSLASWTDFSGDEYKAFSGTAVYTTTIDKVPVADVIKLDLGSVAENASVYLNGDYIGTVIDSPYQLYIPAEKFKGQDELVVRVANSMANRIAYMDKKGMDWKIFYNVNMSARKKENVKNGIFDASNWEPKPSGLLGPVMLIPVVLKQ
jgi:putative lipoprotein